MPRARREKSTPPKAPLSENDLIAWLRRRAGPAGTLIGDDAAILPGGWAVTTDTQIEEVHFVAGLDPALVARRLMAVNLSDLAAMGAKPAFAFLVLAAPPGFDHRRFLDSLLNVARRHGIALAGGDLARHARLTTVLTLIGTKPSGGRWLRRDAARPGDTLWLGGTVAESALGRHVLKAGARIDGRSIVLPIEMGARDAAAARRAVWRHLLPQPQLELGEWLGRRRRASAIDLSDGLSRDLERLCRESGTGAEVERDRLPLADRHRAVAERFGLDPFALALSGGEDYVLLFSLPARVTPPERFACTRIGRVTNGGLWLDTNRERIALSAAGWDHLELGG